MLEMMSVGGQRACSGFKIVRTSVPSRCVNVCKCTSFVHWNSHPRNL